MGFYLDCHRDFDKAEMLILALEAVEIPAPVFDAREDPLTSLPRFVAGLGENQCLVAVVETDTHDAAAVAFDDRELAFLVSGLRGRPCRWLLIRKDLAALNCPAYANWLFKAKGPLDETRGTTGRTATTERSMRSVRGLRRACLAFVAINGIFAVHESGHFLAARWARVTVREFSLGIGPALLHRTIGGTTYAVRAIPFGAYVDLATGPETVIIGSLDRVSPWAQAGIFAAGPLVNIVFGLVVILLLDRDLDSLDDGPASSARILGPIGVIGALARNMGRGWRPATVAAGVFSVDIGLSNLIPLPPLDGGKILWLAVKHLFRVGPKVELWVIVVSTVLFLLVVIGTIVADLRHRHRLRDQ